MSLKESILRHFNNSDDLHREFVCIQLAYKITKKELLNIIRDETYLIVKIRKAISEA